MLSCGFSPKREKTGESWFSSPLRPGDRDPSFKVDESLNLWYDFGSGIGGSIIDFVMIYHGYSFQQAVTHLEGYGGIDFSFTGKQEVKPGIELLEITPIKSQSLIRYLVDERRINLDIARLYIGEARYRVNEKTYYSISFRNDRDGYELRNPYYKSAISPKHYTTIPGKMEGMNVFEGFIDFLSALTMHKTSKLKFTSIILNSVSNISKLPDLSGIRKINLFLDNDTAGETATQTISSTHSNTHNYARELYPNHNDLNEMLTSLKP